MEVLFAERLKKLRKENNMTQEQLSKILDVERPTIAGYETKRKEPNYEKLMIIANYFIVSIDYLLGVRDY